MVLLKEEEEMRSLGSVIIFLLCLSFISWFYLPPFHNLRRVKESSYIAFIKSAPKFQNLVDCFTWWQAFIGGRLPFHKTLRELAKEDKIPQTQAPTWYCTALILSSIFNPDSLTEKDKQLLKQMDEHIKEGLKGILSRLNGIDKAILSGIMEGYQEAMMPRMADGMVLGEALIPELMQRLKQALRSQSYNFRKSVILDVLRYMIDSAKGTKERFKEEWGKIVKEALSEAMEKISRGEVRIDDMGRIKELIKERVKEKASRIWDIQLRAVKAEVKDIMDEVYIDPRIQAAFPFLPLLVKALLSAEPALLQDPEIQDKIMEYMQEGMDQSWLNEVIEEGKGYYKNSIAVSPVLKIYLISGIMEDILNRDEELREEIKKLLEVGE
jgi:hypothetical protein